MFFYPGVGRFLGRRRSARWESLPIAVNYSKTIHLVFPSAVKYNQAVTDFVAVDNPESVPNILRIKANRKSFSKQTTVSVATEGGFLFV